ncbi:heterokaryon incompatibility protein-domain-containing protein [Xylariaceae sp. FL0016]|nr:heterokaryon incompatibility protein-domain-containing protein [Xylariaceae sp. FL0016]
MFSPEQYHSCTHCSKFVVDLERRLHPGCGRADEVPNDMFFFDATLQDVLHGIVAECDLCVWLNAGWSAFDAEHYRKLTRDATSTIVCAQTYSDSLVDRLPLDEITFIGLWVVSASSSKTGGRCQVRTPWQHDVFTVDGDRAEQYIWNRPVSCCPASADNFCLARSWLERCSVSHSTCSDMKQTYMPRRVLRLRPGLQTSEFRVFIEEPKEVEPFTSLSYCWGKDQQYKMTKARITSGDFELDWNRIAKSIQDAVRVTVGIGLHCLWVDSLCIIQDDEQDKAEQIADMARIYNQATVTIVASKANQAADGFLDDINLGDRTNLAVKLPFRCPGPERTLGTAFITNFNTSRNAEPINSRAWTFQEYYLSNRILEFTSLQMRWTCASANKGIEYCDGWKWERNLGNDNAEVLNPYHDLKKDIKEMESSRSSEQWMRDWVHMRWSGAVSHYTARELSVPTDKVLAISGIAQVFARHIKEVYMAGFWASTLPSHLCWHTMPDQKSQRLPSRSGLYQGPSWSWLSVNSHIYDVYSRACQSETLVALLNVDIELVSASAKYGAIRHGVLTLRGRAREAAWNASDGSLSEIGHTLPGNALPLAKVFPDAAGELDGPSHANRSVTLLEIGNCVGGGKRGPVGLVLEASPVHRGNESIPRFRRTGLFHINTKVPRGQSRSEEAEREMRWFEATESRVLQVE